MAMSINTKMPAAMKALGAEYIRLSGEVAKHKDLQLTWRKKLQNIELIARKALADVASLSLEQTEGGRRVLQAVAANLESVVDGLVCN